MPYKYIPLGPGTLYFNTPEGPQRLGEVKEIEFTEEDPEQLSILGEPNKKTLVSAVGSGEITLTVELHEAFRALLDIIEAEAQTWGTVWNALKSMLERAAKDPRTPRLRHLAQHSKNKRIRKKNAKRLYQIMKGE